MGRRYAVARRLAGLFASYARQRPQLLIDWESGADGGVSADLDWQPHLWRALLDRVDADPPHIRHAKTLATLQESPTELPERLSLFGHTRLPSTEIELLDALSTHHDLHLWLPHPSDGCGSRSPTFTARSPAAATPATARSAIRCWPPSAAIFASCSAACRRTRRPTNTSLVRPAPTAPTPCWAGCSPTSPPTRCGATDATLRGRRPLGAGAQLPRPCAPNRRSPRGFARRARRRRDARTARHPRHVPGHRDLRAADRRRLRPRRHDQGRASRAPAAGAARRPVARADQPAARRRLATARAGQRARHVERGAQPRAGRAGAGALRVHRRQPRGHHPLGAADQHPLGLRPRTPQALRRRLHPEHMAFRHRPRARRGGDVRRLAGLDRDHAAARRRQQQPRRARGPAGRVRRPPAARRRIAHRRKAVAGVADRAGARHRPAGVRRRRRRLADQPAAARVRRRADQRRRPRRHADAAARHPRAAGPPPRRAARRGPTSAPAR